MNLRTVVKKFIPSGLFPKIEPYGHLAEAIFFNVINGFPARGLKVIGVTGTNGKTTTSFLIHKMLHEAGYSLRANSKTLEGAQHPDRDAQFRHIHDTCPRTTSPAELRTA